MHNVYLEWEPESYIFGLYDSLCDIGQSLASADSVFVSIEESGCS